MTAATLAPLNKIKGITPSREVKKINLSTPDDLRREMAQVYRLTKAGRIDPTVGTKLTYILAQIGKMHELSNTEKRINALENALSADNSANYLPPPGGRGVANSALGTIIDHE